MLEATDGNVSVLVEVQFYRLYKAELTRRCWSLSKFKHAIRFTSFDRFSISNSPEGTNGQNVFFSSFRASLEANFLRTMGDIPERWLLSVEDFQSIASAEKIREW